MGIWKTLNKNTKDLGKELNKKEQKPKVVKETKCTCNACGNVWYYGKQEAWEQKANTMSNVGKSLACCSGCLPSLFIPDKKVVDLDKCPKCGSKAIKKEEVMHSV
ncbi:MAG: hypothetical protein SVO01_13465 [Thermotogota bacterium]|nr:hypothetical protein [Thermotogota bacterium]